MTISNSFLSDGDETPDVVVPDVVGYVEGYRFFIVRGDKLHSQNAGSFGGRGGGWAWEPGKNEALCFAGEPRTITAYKNGLTGNLVQVEIVTHGPIPEPDCACGFWFYRDKKSLERNHYTGCVAKIRAWGRVIEGTLGWRSEFAEVMELYARSKEETALLEPVAKRYNVPIVKPEAPPKLIGQIMSVSDPVKASNSSHWRPLQVDIRMVGSDYLETFKIWPSASAQSTPRGQPTGLWQKRPSGRYAECLKSGLMNHVQWRGILDVRAHGTRTL